MAIDYTTSLGRVRLLAGDVDETNLLLTDEQITALLAMDADVRSAAAQALDIIASSEALVSKKIRTQDLSTDGPAVAKELRAQATELRRQAADGDDTTGMDIVDFDPWAGTLGYE